MPTVPNLLGGTRVHNCTGCVTQQSRSLVEKARVQRNRCHESLTSVTAREQANNTHVFLQHPRNVSIDIIFYPSIRLNSIALTTIYPTDTFVLRFWRETET